MSILLIKNGLWLAALGIIAGFPYLKAIKKVRDNKEQWRITHLASILAGGLLISIGLAYPKFPLDPFISYWMGFSMIISNWLFAIGMLLSGYSGERGLTWKTDNIIGKLIFVLYSIAAFSSLPGFVWLVWVGITL